MKRREHGEGNERTGEEEGEGMTYWSDGRDWDKTREREDTMEKWVAGKRDELKQ